MLENHVETLESYLAIRTVRHYRRAAFQLIGPATYLNLLRIQEDRTLSGI